jgi:hypothetical protein
MACFKEDGRPSDEAVSVELRDDGLYSVSCSRGHNTVTAIQEQKFEVLFDLGAMALLDGYPREAISSIAAALERFLEYYVRVIALKHNLSEEVIVAAWRPLSRQSERQLGAFLLAYLLENGTPVEPLVFDARPVIDGRARGETPPWAEFRNRVVHQGYIPTTVEALAYGDLVYQWIYRLIFELKKSCSDAMTRATFLHVRRANQIGGGTTVATMSIPTLISLVRADAPKPDLAAALADLEKYRRWLYTRPNTQMEPTRR